MRKTETEILLFIALNGYVFDVRVCYISGNNGETQIVEMLMQCYMAAGSAMGSDWLQKLMELENEIVLCIILNM